MTLYTEMRPVSRYNSKQSPSSLAFKVTHSLWLPSPSAHACVLMDVCLLSKACQVLALGLGFMLVLWHSLRSNFSSTIRFSLILQDLALKELLHLPYSFLCCSWTAIVINILFCITHSLILFGNFANAYAIFSFSGGSVVKNLPANAWDVGWIPGLGRFPEEGNGNPLQHSCLRNPMGRGTWRAIVHGVTKESDMT